MLVPPCSVPDGLLHVMSKKGLVNTPEIQVVWAPCQPLTVPGEDSPQERKISEGEQKMFAELTQQRGSKPKTF